MDEMTETARDLELKRRWAALKAERLAENKRRERPGIGYGILDLDEGDRPRYTASIDIALPVDADADDAEERLVELVEMMEHTVKLWLLDIAPCGTRTTLVDVTDE
jgi:hypothetical protein